MFVFVIIYILSTHSSTDRTQDCGSCDRGSIPLGCTKLIINIKIMEDDMMYKIYMFLIVFLYTIVIVSITYLLTKYVFLKALCVVN